MRGLLVSISLLLGCADDAPPPAFPFGQAPPPDYTFEAPPSPMAGALQTRTVIARTATPVTICPSLGANWSGSFLFSGAGQPTALRRFCRYTWKPTTPPTQGDLDAAVAMSTPTLAIYPDRPAVVPMTDLIDTWAQSATIASLFEAGSITSMTGAPPATVKVAVVDNHPTRTPAQQPWASPLGGHGQAMALALRELTCDDAGNCPVDIASRIAMQLRAPAGAGGAVVRNPNQVGHFGSIADLAVAIRAEVAAWNPAVHDALVLNLSLAWHPTYGAATSPDEHPDTAAVYAALLDAHCRGALVIAAAGNDMGGNAFLTGPAVPAAWGQFAVTAAQCQDAIQSNGAAPGAPLLYAASAVDDAGHEVGNARASNFTPFAAYGDSFLLDDPVNAAFPATGSSVSAAVISAAASAVLAWRPDLAPHTAMSQMHAWGEDLGPADAQWLAVPFLPDNAARFDVCQLLTEACIASPGPGCSATHLPVCNTMSAPITLNQEKLAAWKQGVDSLPYAPLQLPSGDCPSTLYKDALAADPDLACPLRQRYDDDEVSPFTDPQPTEGHCPTCVLERLTDALLLQSNVAFNLHGDRSITVLRFNGSVSTYHLPALGAVNQIQHTLPAGSLIDVQAALWTSTVAGITRTNAMTVTD